MKKSPIQLKPLQFSILLGCLAISQQANAQLNTFGATGLFNIPNADVAPFGHLSFDYNNHLDPQDIRDNNTAGENFLLNIGAYPNIEANIRLLHIYDSENHQINEYGDFYKRDLSGNLKWQIPLISNWIKSPNTRFAVGMTDVGGLAVNFRRYYGVASHKWHNFDLTAGFAHAPEGATNRTATATLDGFFGGITYQPFDWLKVSAEHESSGERAGIDFYWHQPLGTEFSLHAGTTLFSTAQNEDPSFRIGITIPFGHPQSGSDWIESVKPTTTAGYQDTSNTTIESVKSTYTPLFKFDSTLEERKALQTLRTESYGQTFSVDALKSDAIELRNALEENGLDNIHLGVEGKNTLVLAYENRAYNWSEIDALGSVISTLSNAKLPRHFNLIKIITLNNGVPLLKTTIGSANLDEMLKQSVSNSDLRSWLRFEIVNDIPDSLWILEPRNQEKAKLSLSLAYRAYYGTEWSNWDYSVALRPVVEVPLWTGAYISSAHHLLTQNSYGFSEGRFTSKALQDEQTELMIHQTLHPLDGLVNTLSYGQLSLGGYKLQGYMNQGEYQLLNGYGKIFWRQGNMDFQDFDANVNYNVVGAELSWHQANLAAGFHTGSYIEGDNSNVYYAKSKLGNATVSLALTQSDITWERIDALISFPIGPRKNYAMGPVTIGGDPQWRTGLGTVTDNPIAPKNNLIDTHPEYKLVGAVLGNSNRISRRLYEDNRLTPAYLESNLMQLVQAIKYSQK